MLKKVVLRGPILTNSGYGVHRRQVFKALLKRKDIDLYVQPSTSEGSPITLKEAMASSLPILASNAGGIPEIIKHNQTGILFESGNRQELEKGLIKIIAMDDSQKKEMGEKARASSIKQFNIKKTSNTLYNIYNSILDSDQTK